jgi:hypothetical protein
LPSSAPTLLTATLRTRTALGFALLALGLGGAGSADASRLAETDTDAADLENGLQLVPTWGTEKFWVRPGVDLGAYDRVALLPISLEYKGTPRHYRLDPGSQGVLLTEREYERLQRLFYRAFKTGLARGAGFGPASRSDPGLLWVSTSLLDVVVRNNEVPLSNEVIVVQDYGEMTLRVEFTDSETGETIARFEERRSIAPSGEFLNKGFRRDGFTYWMAVRGNLDRWSELVRRRMHEQRVRTAQN